MTMTYEQIMAKLYELRKEAGGDPDDPEFVALDHAFKFLSYRTTEFKAYLAEAARLDNTSAD